jgi:hypothetical protein
MQYGGAKSRLMRGAARRQFVGAHHAMDKNVVSDAHHAAAFAVVYPEILIGDAAR